MRKFYALSGMGLLCLAVLFPVPLQAQLVVSETVLELSVDKEDKIAVEYLNGNPDGSFTLYTFVQQALSDKKCMPALQIYELDSLLKLRGAKTIQYRASDSKMQGGKITGKPGSNGRQLSAASYQELLAAYPSFYRTRKQEEDFYEALQNQWGRPLIRHTRLAYSYDSLSHSFLATKKEAILGVPLGSFAENNLHIHDEVKINREGGLVSIVLGEKEEGKKETSPYLKQTILLSSLKGNLLATHELSFSFPMEVRLQQFVYDQEKKLKGIAYVFGPARRFGKWETDPDPTNYQVVVLDTLGNKILHHPFRYGGRESASEPFFASVVEGAFYFLGKGVGPEPDYHLFIFDTEGVKKQTLIHPDQLYEQTLGPYEKGLQNEYASNFVPAGAKQLAGGDFVIYGMHRYTKAIATKKPATNSSVRARYRYPAYVFLQFDKEGNLVQNYVVAREQDAKPARMELLSSTNGALHLLVYEACNVKAELKDYQVFRTSDEQLTVNKNYREEAEVPLILSLHLQQKQTNVVRFTEGFVSLGRERLFFYNGKTRELLLVGKLMNQEGPLRVMLKKVKL